MSERKQRRKPGPKPKWPTIRKRGVSWVVDCGKVFGKRERKQFEAIEEAEAHAEAQRARRATQREVEHFETKERSVQLTSMTDNERMDALQALTVLDGHGSLVAAAQFWKKHAAPAAGARKLRDFFAEYLDTKVKAQCRPITIADVKAKLGRFVFDNATRYVHAVTTHDVEKWIDSRKGKSPETRDGYRRAFVALFNYAVKRGYRDGNPAAVIEAPKKNRDHTHIAVLTPDEAQRLMAAAQKHDPKMVPFFAIGLFAGLRPENELAGLDWASIDFEHSTIHVQAASAKTRRERYVDMSANLIEWLTPFKQDAGPVHFARASFNKVREKAGLIPPREEKGHYELKRADGRTFKQKKLGARTGEKVWKADIMRHTFASYHLAAHNDAGKTASQLGHGTHLEMLFQHYRRAVRAEQAKAFWAIRPPAAA